jgi:hypothetical protein
MVSHLTPRIGKQKKLFTPEAKFFEKKTKAD